MLNKIKYAFHPLEFKTPSGTSRGILTAKDSWYIVREETDSKGIGEISIIDGLGLESRADIEHCLAYSRTDIMGNIDFNNYPAIKFALEILERSDRSSDAFHLFDTPFYSSGIGIPINGLIWMGTKEQMYSQIKSKLSEGYRCLKLKIGAIDFEEELELLRYVRSQFSADEIELRVDANGAFSPDTALEKLKRLAAYELHSIEQPIKAGQWEAMAQLCEDTPLAIALDEDLIGVSSPIDRQRLLETVRPHYIILKPSLIGGFQDADEWIALSESMKIGWWATSALESNIGLNAIAQWVSTKNINMPQGLGTGQLYTNNISSPLIINQGQLYYDLGKSWDQQWIDQLEFI